MKGIAVMIFVSGILVMMVLGCDNTSETVRKKKNTRTQDESLIKVNRYLVKSEQEDINNYIRRHGWEMLETGTGLRYMIYEQGDGPQASIGQVAELKYKLWLINGDLVYTSDKDGIKSFLLGRGGVESGLEEGILLLHEGDKARFILPAHLAYGLLGDDKRIPPRTAIIYELELIKLN